MVEVISADVHDAETRELEASFVSSAPEPALADSPDAVGAGMTLGRYQLIERVGRGGMGEVFRAYDPKLRREVALKVVSVSRRDSASDGHDDLRVIREAQALARLTHPNVVSVHDADVVGSTVFITMEYVPGRTLATWLHDERPAWPRVLEVMCEAGRGLAAAHAAGIVHRDFKPSNVILGDDGRVRVLDFGLARENEQTKTSGVVPIAVSPAASGSHSASSLVELTRTGSVLGTPAYMSPEQRDGRYIDARTDQFSFCVTLYEGFYGERPFSRGGGDVPFAALAFPSRVPIPARIKRALQRGLQRPMNQRFDSMDELLAELQAGLAAHRRRWVRRGGGVLMGGGMVGALAFGMTGAGPCAQAEEQLQGVWDQARRDALRESILGTGLANATATAERVDEGLERYAAAWREGYQQACEATHVEGVQSVETLELRMACLSQRRHSMSTLVGLLVDEPDATLLGMAVAAVGKLPELAACDDVPALRRRSGGEADPDLPAAPELNEVREQIAEADALYIAGRFERALALATEARARAESLGDEQLRGEALLALGMAQGQLEPGASVAALEQAYYSAVEVQDPELAFNASVHLAFVLTERLQRLDDAERWINDSRAWLRAVQGGPTGEATWLSHMAQLRLAQGRPAEGLELYQQALALRQQDDDPVGIAGALHNLGIAQYSTGAYDDALATWTAALEQTERALGPDHPRVGDTANAIAAVHVRLGHLAQAQAMFERAVAVKERAHGPDNPVLATILDNLGMVVRMQGDLERAQALHERALAIWEGQREPSPHLPTTLSNLAAVAYERARFGEAEALYRRATALLTERHGPDHPDLAWSINATGATLIEQGKHAAAIPELERALALRERALGAEHPDLGEPLLELARAHRFLGRLEEASARLERAMTLLATQLPADHPHVLRGSVLRAELLVDRDRPDEALAELRTVEARLDAKQAGDVERVDLWFCQARALHGTDPSRARALATRALDVHRAQAVINPRAVERIEAWLAERRDPASPSPRPAAPLAREP